MNLEDLRDAALERRFEADLREIREAVEQVRRLVEESKEVL